MTETAKEITPGSEVTLHFSLSTPEGLNAVSTFDEEPAQIVMGDGSLTEGLELALYGLKKGDKQTLLLESDQAYGPRDEGKVQTMPRSDFPEEIKLEPGLVIGFQAPGGAEVAGIIKELSDSEVEVDFNHPLAGHDIVFSVEILEINGPSGNHSDN
jgi:FKBP-type peptidyl-prolyl cis-trans isomerase SlpA